MKRTHYCEKISNEYIGQQVEVCGWVQRQRDLGQLIFIDLRDRTGLVQLAFGGQTDPEVFKQAFSARAEFVLWVRGTVRERTSKNLKMKNGDVEIEVLEMETLAQAETPPFEIVPNSNAGEDLRMRYRFLDLRREDLQQKIVARHKIVGEIRRFLVEKDFLEIETPILIKSTPEGARDYLVPSRVFPKKFFALPQSPQLYKQMLMAAGLDRYFQVARCFRDEDLRADRQPEFTQVDLEMSFVCEEDVMEVAEGMVRRAFYQILQVDLPKFSRMTFDEAMRRFGSDKPDLRFDVELVDLTDMAKNCAFKVLSEAAKTGAVVAVNAKGLAQGISRKEIDQLGLWIKDYGAKGLAWTKLTIERTSSSSFEKFLSEEEIAKIREKTQVEPGDVLFVVACEEKMRAFEAMGALRCELAKRHGLVREEWQPLWVTDFPLLEFDKETGRFVAKHHPFTAPNAQDLQMLEENPGAVRARAYDLVLNGCEIGGGSIRVNDPQLQERILKLLNFSHEQAHEQFGFLLEAMRYGMPPHGGMAFGLDRLVMLMLGCTSIREVIAFPKVSNSSEPMTNSPAQVSDSQLRELGIL